MRVIVHNMKDDPFPKGKDNHILIDRRTHWGNPYKIKPGQGRAEVIALHRESVESDLQDKESKLLKELKRLRMIGNIYGELHLYCWCYPDACHGDIYKEKIERMEE